MSLFGSYPIEIEVLNSLIDPEPAEKEVERFRSLHLQLPTSNDALLRGNPGAFYQALDTTIPGLRPFGWMGGQYGFVRNVARTPAGQTFTRVHQGVDIRPLYRDRRGEPQDTVRAISDGRVVYVNRSANASSYGLYVVIEHEWDGSPVYSLMAHLASIHVRPGDELVAGAPVGRMGYTGRGINLRRAHLHLEIALMMNTNYQRFHSAYYRSRNDHGIFNGLNLRGIDVSGLYLALQEEPYMSFTDFMRRKAIGYTIAIPGQRPLEILERYPWLAADGVYPDDVARPGAWLVSFTREGVPLEVARQYEPVSGPTLVYVSEEIRRGHLSTGGILTRTGNTYDLSRAGRGHAALLATTQQGTPGWF